MNAKFKSFNSQTPAQGDTTLSLFISFHFLRIGTYLAFQEEETEKLKHSNEIRTIKSLPRAYCPIP